MSGRYLAIFLVAGFFFSLCVMPAHADWLIYHKPAFRGKVIDAETKEPIEGAVVVVAYSKWSMGPIESYGVVIKVRETLTDKNGEFYIPPYTTVIQPFSTEEWARFIIYKPGYGNYPGKQVSPPKLGVSPEKFFSKERVGTKGEMKWLDKTIKVTFGVVELPRLKTREERSEVIGYVSFYLDEFLEEQKNLIRLINEEEKNLGLQKTDPYKAREALKEMGKGKK